MKDKAIADFFRQDYYAALDSIMSVKKCAPKDPEVYYWLGKIYYARSEKEKAKENFEQAIQLRPGYPEAYVALADQLLEEGRYDDAIKNYMVAAQNEQYRGAYLAWNNMGYIYMQQGKYPEAGNALQHSINLNRNFCWTYSNLGELQSKQKKYADAYINYVKAIQLCPKLARGHRLLGLEYNRQGKINRACQEFFLAVKNSDPQSEDGKSAGEYMRLLNCYDKAGK
jgi:tetratricopeptide (TPR) repeat protein